MSHEFQTIRLSIEQGIARLTLACPDKLNAQSPRMWSELRVARDVIAAADVRCLVISGEGRAFSSGLDLREQGDGGTLERGASLAESDGDQVVSNILRVQQTFRWIHEAPYATVAAVQGYALGAGMQLALACDLRIATTDAQFALPELNLGIVPDMCGTGWLPQLVGNAVAKEMVLLGGRMAAEQALRVGLVNRVVEVGELEATVTAIAQRIAAQPPIAVLYAKAAIDATVLEDSYRLAAEGTATCLRSDDFRETRQAARERRPAVYKGR